jgi:hypothetical protein
MEASTFKSIMWTGRAFRKSRLDVDMGIQNVDGVMVPAMPDNLFGTEKKFRKIFKTLCSAKMEDCLQFSKSFMTVYNVSTVPVSFDISKITNQEHLASLARAPDRLDTMYTDKIMPLNIGSNVGLLQIVRNHYEDEGQNRAGVCQRYSAFTTDVDIFDRILKVAHTHSEISLD